MIMRPFSKRMCKENSMQWDSPSVKNHSCSQVCNSLFINSQACNSQCISNSLCIRNQVCNSQCISSQWCKEDNSPNILHSLKKQIFSLLEMILMPITHIIGQITPFMSHAHIATSKDSQLFIMKIAEWLGSSATCYFWFSGLFVGYHLSWILAKRQFTSVHIAIISSTIMERLITDNLIISLQFPTF